MVMLALNFSFLAKGVSRLSCTSLRLTQKILNLIQRFY